MGFRKSRARQWFELGQRRRKRSRLGLEVVFVVGGEEEVL